MSAGVVILEHLSPEEDVPIFMNWPEMLRAWPELSGASVSRGDWERVLEGLHRLGVGPVEGNRLGGDSAAVLWRRGMGADRGALCLFG